MLVKLISTITLSLLITGPCTGMAASLSVNRVTETAGEGSSGTVCLITSSDLESSQDLTNLKAFLKADQGGQEVEISPFVRGSELCATGFKPGGHYSLTLKKGLRASDGSTLDADDRREVLMPDLGSYLSLGRGSLLPNTLSEGVLYIKSVNLKGVRAALYRLPKSDLIASSFGTRLLEDLDAWSFRTLVSNHAEKLGETMLTPEDSRNEAQYLELRLADLAGEKPADGVYVLAAADAATHKSAEPGDEDYQSSESWFSRVLIVSDLGVTAFAGGNSLYAEVHSLKSANPLAGAKVSLISRNNTVLGSVQTDSSGIAVFSPELLNGSLGRTPAALSVSMGSDFLMLPLSSATTLNLNGGAGGTRSPVGHSSAYPDLATLIFTDRGIFRPGETVDVTALIRNADLQAADLQAVTLEISRPDGLCFERLTLKPEGSGFFEGALTLPQTAMRGSWSASIKLGEHVLASRDFAVQDFIPSTLGVDVSTDGPISAGTPGCFTLKGSFNYGGPAAGLDANAYLTLIPESSPFQTGELRDFHFGPDQDEAAKIVQHLSLESQKLDATGVTSFRFTPEVHPYAMRATLQGAVYDAQSSTDFKKSVLVAPGTALLGILHQAGENRLGFVSVNAEGHSQPQDLRITLLRIVRDYQYVFENGAWRFIRHESQLPVSAVTLSADRLDEGCELNFLKDGEYLVKVKGLEGGESALRFFKGYALQGDPFTPDTMQLSLDKETYRSGDQVKLAVDAPQSGFVCLAFGSDRVFAVRRYEVHEGENFLKFKLIPEFRHGAHVLATFASPVTAVPGPSHAAGMAYVRLENEKQHLKLKLGSPDLARPLQKLSATLKAEGENHEIRYTAALVDEGILSLTGFKEPDPFALFTAPRGYGISVHDLTGLMLRAFVKNDQGFGALDEMLGAAAYPAALQSFNERIVALHHGVATLENGEAEISFSLPDHQGALRLMVVAASDDALGFVSSRIKVHDQVPLNASLPAVAHPGDSFKGTVTLNNLEDEDGSFSVAFSCEGALKCEKNVSQLNVPKGSLKSLALTAATPVTGDGVLRLQVKGTHFEKSRSFHVSVHPLSPEIFTTVSKAVKAGESVDLPLQPAMLEGSQIRAVAGELPYADTRGLKERLLKESAFESLSAQALSLRALMQQSADHGALIQERLYALEAAFDVHGYAYKGDAYDSALAFIALREAAAKGFAVSFELMERLKFRLNAVARDSGDCVQAVAALNALSFAGSGSLSQLRYLFDRQGKFAPLALCGFAEAFSRYGDHERAQAALSGIPGALKERLRLENAIDAAVELKERAKALEELQSFENTAAASAVFDTAMAARTAAYLNESSLLSALDFSVLKDRLMQDGGACALIYETAGKFETPRELDVKPLADGKVTLDNSKGQAASFVTLSIRGYPKDLGALEDGMQIVSRFCREDGSAVDASKPLKSHESVVLLVEAQRRMFGGTAAVRLALPTGFTYLKAMAPNDGSPFGELSFPSNVQKGDDTLVLSFDYLPYDSNVLRFAMLVRPDLNGAFSVPAMQIYDSLDPALHLGRPEQTSLTVEP